MSKSDTIVLGSALAVLTCMILCTWRVLIALERVDSRLVTISVSIDYLREGH